METTLDCYLVLMAFFLGLTEARVQQFNSCKAHVDGRIVNLEPLQRQDGFPRFSISHQGWNYTFNPCESYNDPLDPHSGRGDQCLYVAMCRSRWRPGGDVAEYFTLGIQRTLRIHLRRPYYLDDLSSMETSEEKSPEEATPDNPSKRGSHGNQTSNQDEDSGEGGDAAEEYDDIYNDAFDDNFEDYGVSNSSVQNDSAVNIVAKAHASETDTKRIQNYIININQTENIPANDLTTTEMSEIRHFATEQTASIKSRQDKRIINQRTKREKKQHNTKGAAENRDYDVDYANEGRDEDYVIGKVNDESDLPRIVLRLRGIRSMKRQKTYIYLVCNPLLRLVEEAQFAYVGKTDSSLYFELHHKCCCPGGCANGHIDTLPINETLALTSMQRRLLELEEKGPKHLWIVLVVNASVLITAVMIGLVCCRKGGSAGPYSMLPALHSNRMFNSVESMASTVIKGPSRPPEHLEYSTPMLQSSKLPLLDNCVIPARDLEIGQRLGGGLFGDTYIAEWRDRQVAVKRFTVGVHQSQLNDEDQDWLAREVSYLARQRNKHLVTVLGICLELRQPHVVNEFIDGQSLKDFLIRELHHTTLARRVKMLIQVTEGMHFLHSAKYPVLHRDLRASNLLITVNDKIKICDFGITKLVQRLRQECTGREGCYCQKHFSALPASIRWTAPEILQAPTADEAQTDAFTLASDVYSFAMVLWEVASGMDPYEDIQDEREVLAVVIHGGRPNPDAIQGCIPHYRELMKVCWDSEPDARPTFKQLTMHLKTVLHVARKFETSSRARSDSNGGSSYLKSALSIHIEKI